jgi:hypothetical protein
MGGEQEASRDQHRTNRPQPSRAPSISLRNCGFSPKIPLSGTHLHLFRSLLPVQSLLFSMHWRTSLWFSHGPPASSTSRLRSTKQLILNNLLFCLTSRARRQFGFYPNTVSTGRRQIGPMSLRPPSKGVQSLTPKDFEFCICVFPNLCYRVFIPVVEATYTPSRPGEVCVTGLPARTASTFVPPFFAR